MKHILFKFKWLLVLLLIILGTASVYLFSIRAILKYTLVIGISICIGCIIYSFLSIFLKNKKLKYLIIILFLGGCLFWYYIEQKPSNIIYMQEDVLYIRPNNNDIYDGSKNDPNLHPDKEIK